MESWRRLVVCLAALALILQGLALFAQSSAALGAGSVGATPSVHQAMVNCPFHKSGGKAPIHRDDAGGCPMCQTLGFALPGAPVIALAPIPSERLLGFWRSRFRPSRRAKKRVTPPIPAGLQSSSDSSAPEARFMGVASSGGARLAAVLRHEKRLTRPK
jgi:hypothetical protein